MVQKCCKSLILVAVMMTVASFFEPGIADAAQPSLTWQLEWAPQAQVDGLKAFEGVEDDANHSDPGVKHIYADGADYRIDMPLQERDKMPDRQRNEVKGMVDRDGNILRIEKRETHGASATGSSSQPHSKAPPASPTSCNSCLSASKGVNPSSPYR